MNEVLSLISTAGDAGTAALAAMMLVQHRRVARIEKKLWPDVFGGV